MRLYLASLAVGTLVGAIYGFLHVRSPAPPVIALVGLFGILMGEQLPSLLQHAVTRERIVVGWLMRQVKPHMFGELPCGTLPSMARSEADEQS
jgi:XapX domain-containing protein